MEPHQLKLILQITDFIAALVVAGLLSFASTLIWRTPADVRDVKEIGRWLFLLAFATFTIFLVHRKFCI